MGEETGCCSSCQALCAGLLVASARAKATTSATFSEATCKGIGDIKLRELVGSCRGEVGDAQDAAAGMAMGSETLRRALSAEGLVLAAAPAPPALGSTERGWPLSFGKLMLLELGPTV